MRGASGVIVVLLVLPVLLLGGLLAARSRPGVIIGAYAFVLPFGSAIPLPGPEAVGSLADLVGLLATGALAVRLLQMRQRARPLHPSVAGWPLLLAWLAVTALWTPDPTRSVQVLMILAALVALHTTAVLNRIDVRDLRVVEFGAVAGALVVALRALQIALSGRLEQTSSRLARFTFEEGDPNITAATMLLGFAVAAWWSIEASTGIRRAAGLLSAAAILLGIVLAGSRGGLVGAVVALAVVLVAGRSVSAGRIATLVGGLVLLVVVALPSLPPGLQAHLTAGNSTGRTAIWAVGWRSCPEVCLAGNGVGTFASAYREVYLTDLRATGFGDRPWSAHNAFLSMLVEAGVVGAALFVGTLGLLVAGAARLPERWRGPPLAALVALLVSNLLVSNLNFRYFWLTLTYVTLAVHLRGGTSRIAFDGGGVSWQAS